MSPNAQRIAIAEVCGWTAIKDDPVYYLHRYGVSFPNNDNFCGRNPKGQYDVIPDYLNDLNAMQPAVRLLTEEQHGTFVRELMLVVVGVPSFKFVSEEFEFANATAAQRAEALLRAVGKWDPIK